jgi:hypothetical protein
VSVSAAKQPDHRAIEQIRVGQRVIAGNPERADARFAADTAVDPATWRLLRLHAEDRWEDGTLDTIEVETLQESQWIESQHAVPGAAVPLPVDLVEMGMPATLRARVVAVEPCPSIAQGPGRVVLTTINHLNRYVFRLSLIDSSGRTETVGVTGFHKFYSEDRKTWVEVEDLHLGEHVPGASGLLTVSTIARAPGVERVYNITVDREHVYHVSALGALVHNMCGVGTNGHHPWPKYLGGPEKQSLETLSESLHKLYHKGLDQLLPRWRSADYYRGLSPTQQAKNFEILRKYTQAFDAKYRTQLWDAIMQIASAI